MSEFNRKLEQRLAQRNVEQAYENLYNAQAYYNRLLQGQDAQNMMASYGIGEAPSYSDVQNYQMRCGGKPKAAQGGRFLPKAEKGDNFGDMLRDERKWNDENEHVTVVPEYLFNTERNDPNDIDDWSYDKSTGTYVSSRSYKNAEPVTIPLKPVSSELSPETQKTELKPNFNTKAPFYFTPTPYNVRKWQGRDMASTKDAYTQVYGYHPDDEAWAKGLALAQAGIRDPEVDALLPRRVRNRSVGYMMMNSNPNYFNKPADVTDAAEVTDTAEGNDATPEQAATETTEQTPIDTNPIKTEGTPATETATSVGNGSGTVTSGSRTVTSGKGNGTGNQGNGAATSNHAMFTSPAQVKKEAQEKIYKNITSPTPGNIVFNTSGKSPRMSSNPSQFFGWTSSDKPKDLEFGLNTPQMGYTVYTPGQNGKYTEQKVTGTIDDIASEYFKNNPGATKFYTQDDKGKPITIYNEKNFGSYRKDPTRGLYNVNGKYLEALSEKDGARQYFKSNPSATEINVNGKTYYNFGNGDVRTYPKSRKYANGGPTNHVDDAGYWTQEEPWVPYYVPEKRDYSWMIPLGYGYEPENINRWEEHPMGYWRKLPKHQPPAYIENGEWRKGAPIYKSGYAYGGDPYQRLPYNPNDTIRFRTERLPLKKGQNIKDYNNPFQPL